MSYSPVPISAPGNPMTEIWQLLDNCDDLYLRTTALSDSYSRILNGSFTDDSNSDGTPDGWRVRLYDGGTSGISTVETAHGGRSFYAVTPGRSGKGGARIETDSMIPASANQIYSLRWKLKASIATLRVRAMIYFYDITKSVLAYKTIYSSNDNPTAWQTVGGQAKSPADTRYIKIIFDLGLPTADGFSGTIYLDDVSFYNGIIQNTQGIYTANGSIIVPKNCSSAFVLASGAGAGGGGGNIQPTSYGELKRNGLFGPYYETIDMHYGAGGGGGGAIVWGEVRVIPGETIPIVIGQAGVGGAEATDGTDGTATSFGDYLIAEGGKKGKTNNSATDANLGVGGAGGSAGFTHKGALMGVAGTSGANGTRGDVALLLTTSLKRALGGDGGKSNYTEAFASDGGNGGGFNYSGMKGLVSEVSGYDARIVNPHSGTGYGAGGGGGSKRNSGANGTNGILLVRF